MQSGVRDDGGLRRSGVEPQGGLLLEDEHGGLRHDPVREECPWNADRADWEYHVHCACSLPGTFASGSPKVVCGAEWGWALIIALACVSAAYVGGALAYSQKVHGAAALPHPVFWHEVRALVEDGLSYTKARALGGGGGGGGSAEGSGGGAAYTAVPEVASASMPAAPATAEGSSDSDGDELVE